MTTRPVGLAGDHSRVLQKSAAIKLKRFLSKKKKKKKHDNKEIDSTLSLDISLVSSGSNTRVFLCPRVPSPARCCFFVSARPLPLSLEQVCKTRSQDGRWVEACGCATAGGKLSHVTGSVKYRKGQEACYLMRVRLTHKIRNAS